MSGNKHPVVNHDEVIDRLINENKQYLDLLNQIKIVLNFEGEFSGLSIVGGLKSLVKKYNETVDKNHILENKLKKLEK